jgi:hypothetical protein
MAMTTGSVQCGTTLRVSGTYPPQGVTGELANHTIPQSAGAEAATLTYGTSSGKVDLITCSDRTLTAGASGTYDLYTGTDLKDLDGLTCAFRKVKLIQVSIVSGGDTAGVTVGGAASDQWVGFFGASGDTLTIYPSGPPFLGGQPAGSAVGTTTKNLKILNNGAVSVTVRITIAGSSV